MTDHSKCQRMIYRIWIDPVDQIVREMICPHHDIVIEYPAKIMIVWPDGKTSTWEQKK